MYKSIVLILLLLLPLSFGVLNSSTVYFSYFITANWKTIPTLDNFTTINVNLITFIYSNGIRPYVIVVKILLPQGILNATAGHYIEDIFPLYTEVQEDNIQFNVTIINSSLPNILKFPVILSLINISGENVSYNTSFTLPYYGTYNFNIKLLNSSLMQGFQEVTFKINTNHPVYNLYVSSPYFIQNISLSYVNGSEDIPVKLFVPFEKIPIFLLPITVQFSTPYNLYYHKQLIIETFVNTSSTLYANVKTLNGVVYPGYNTFNISIINKDNLPISNFTLIVNYNNNTKTLIIPYLVPKGATNLTLSFYANSSVLLKIYAFFYTPLGLDNLTLGNYYFPIIYPINVTWNNGNICIFNNGNVTLYNITVHFGEENIKIQKLSPKERILYPVSIEPKLVYITFYYDNSKFSYWQKVYEVPLVRLSVMYQFANITKLPGSANSYIATLVLYIQNTGNRNITNIYIVVEPNGDTVTPLFYLISQILTNQTIAVPFTIYTTKNTVFNILILYYSNNQTYIENVTIPINYVKPTPGEIISNYLYNYIGKYVLYQVYGVPVIVIAFILLIILISIIPPIRRNKAKE